MFSVLGCPYLSEDSLEKLFLPCLEASYVGIWYLNGVLRTMHVLCSFLVLLYWPCHILEELSAVHTYHFLLYIVFWWGFQLNFYLIYWGFLVVVFILFPKYHFGYFQNLFLKFSCIFSTVFLLYSAVYCFSAVWLVLDFIELFKFVLLGFSF